MATWNYFFEIYRQFGNAPSKWFASLDLWYTYHHGCRLEMQLYIIRKVVLVIRNNEGWKFHSKISVLPHYPQPCPRRKSQNLKSEKLSQPLCMWVSTYNTKTLPVSKNYLTFQNSKHIQTVWRCIYTAINFKYTYYLRYWYFSLRCILCLIYPKMYFVLLVMSTLKKSD